MAQLDRDRTGRGQLASGCRPQSLMESHGAAHRTFTGAERPERWNDRATTAATSDCRADQEPTKAS